MEEYLPLIYTNSIKYDVLTNVDFSETLTRNIGNNGTSNSTSSSNSSSLGVNSDTPQGEIRKAEILGGKYASSTGASESENATNDLTNTSSTTNETYTKRIKGNNGAIITNQRLIKERGALLWHRKLSDTLGSRSLPEKPLRLPPSALRSANTA